MFRTKALSYAILTAHAVAGSDGKVKAAEITQKCELPNAYVAKVMVELAKGQVFKSDRGAAGGYTLARPANKITLLEIYEAVNGQLGDGTIQGLRGALGKSVQTSIGRVNDAIRNVLGVTTLASLVKK